MTLALEYRPRELTDLKGQEHVSLVLTKMLSRWQEGTIELPKGLIFTGSFGCGKTTTARIVAAYLNCLNENSGRRPCAKCAQCDAIFNKFTSDAVLEIDGATSGLVDDVRQLRQTARLSHSGLYRVIVIDEVHSMSAQAFSALLKQLEEPPPQVLYILVTTDYLQVPSTIRSRCLTFTFTPVAQSAIASRLEEICEREGFEYDAAGLSYLARQANGAMRDALMLLEQATIASSASYEAVSTLWPSVADSFASEFVSTASAASMKAGQALIRDAFDQTRDSVRLVDSIIDYLADRAVEYAETDRRKSRLYSLCVPRAWDLRIQFRHAPQHDPTLIEALWHVLAVELGALGKAEPRPPIEAIDSELKMAKTTDTTKSNILTELQGIIDG